MKSLYLHVLTENSYFLQDDLKSFFGLLPYKML